MVLPEITEEEQETLLLTLGIAAGAMAGQGNRKMVGSIFRLANSLMRNNPNWTPYGVQDEVV